MYLCELLSTLENCGNINLALGDNHIMLYTVEKELLLANTTKELTLRKALNYYTLGINVRNKNSKILKNIQTYLNILYDSGGLLFL